MWESDIGKLLTAIDKIIKDPDRKYDECMIEQFLKSISDELQKLDDDAWNSQAQIILQKLQSFVNDEAFVMMNQARVYKTYLSVFRSNVISDKSFVTVRHYIESFWSSLGSVIINHDLAAVTAVLMTLVELLKSDLVYKWIISQEFQPTISVLIRKRTFEIEDVATLAEFYVETSENYHTKNKAELLLKVLMTNAFERNLVEDHQHLKKLKQLTSKLIRAKSTSILHILIGILEKEPSSDINRALLLNLDISTSLHERFITSSEGSQDSICTICRLLGLIDDQSYSEIVLSQLERKGPIEAIIAFLTESSGEHQKFLLQSYLIGPLALRCDAQLNLELETLVQGLDSSKEHLSDKTVTSCLVQLGRTIDQKPAFLTDSAVALSIRVLLDYVKYSLDTTGEFRNVMLCCSNLRKLLDCYDKLDKDCLLLVNSTALITLRSIDIHDENLKPIVLGLIKLLSDTQRKMISACGEANNTSCIDEVVHLAANCTDGDIQDELDLFLREFHKDYLPEPDETDQDQQLEAGLAQEEYKADIKSSLSDILDYELFSDNILDCY